MDDDRDLCLRYTGGTRATTRAWRSSLALGAGPDANVGTVTNGPLWTATIGTGTWYAAMLSAAASGVLTASVNGKTLGTFTPSAPVASGYVAVATQSAEAAFDNVVVTQP